MTDDSRTIGPEPPGFLPRAFISLRTKFVLFFSLIIIASCSALTWYFLQNKRQEMTTRLLDLGTVLVQSLAHNDNFRYGGLIAEDQVTLNRFIDSILAVDQVIYVVVSGPDGRPLAAKSKGALTSRIRVTRDDARPLYPDPAVARTLAASSAADLRITYFKTTDTSAPIALDGQPVWFLQATAPFETFYDFAFPIVRTRAGGAPADPFTFQSEDLLRKGPVQAPKLYGIVQVGLTELQLQQALGRVFGDSLLLTVVIIVGGILGTHLLTGRITTPLRGLASVARRVSEGDLSATVTPSTRDEVGQLTALFNLMTQSLKERNDAISANLETIRRQVTQLTTLNQASAAITSTLDQDRLLASVLHLLMANLGFARMLLMLYDPDRGTASIQQVAGVSPDMETAARRVEIPVQDDGGLDAELLLHGKPLLILDVEGVAHRMHPDLLALTKDLGVVSFVGVPLRSSQRTLGYLAADRGPHCCTQEDLDVLMTIASHVAVALDNARAYSELEALNQHLEMRVDERTRALQAANERLQEHDRRRSKFVSVASHELRTPMTSIRGFVDNMLDGLTGQLTERQGYYLNRIKHNVERLTRIINQLLDWSRIDIDKVLLDLEPVSLPALASDVAESLQTMAKEKGVLLAVEARHDLPSVRADRDKAEQILWNLIGNAVKFTPAGGRVTISFAEQPSNVLQMCVADTGCGIAPHQLAKVFDEFSKIDSALPGSQGAQLGLFITKSLVRLHGGDVHVESRLGQGSKFYVTLPLHPSSRQKP